MVTKPLFLIGGRGAGKSYVGSLLAQRLAFRFLDTDEMICDRTGVSISEIVQQKGWVAFRQLEREVLASCCELRQCIVATGGGSVVHVEEWNTIKAVSYVFWLKASTATLTRRISSDLLQRDNRPSLTGEDIVSEYRHIYQERKPRYENLADFTINTDSLDREDIVADIVNVLKGCKEK